MSSEAETRLQQLLSEGEALTVEFKAAKQQLPRDLYETVCAFLNRTVRIQQLGIPRQRTVRR